MDNSTTTISYKVINLNSQNLTNDSLIYILMLLLVVLCVLVITIYTRKIKNKNGVINDKIHRYNMFLSIAMGLQIAFILEVINIFRKILYEGNIYVIDLIIVLLLMVLWIGEEIIVSLQFVKK